MIGQYVCRSLDRTSSWSYHQSWRTHGMFLGKCSWDGLVPFRQLLGAWGPSLNGTAIIPSILGAMILLAIFWERGS